MSQTQLCQVADVQTYLGDAAKNAGDVLELLINGASAFIENWCNRKFALTDYTEWRNGTGKERIYLANGPVVSVAAVSVDGYAVQPSPDTRSYGFVVGDNTLYLRPGAGPGAAPRVFTRGIQNVEIQYQAGFATIPPDIIQACIELVASKFAKRTRIDRRSETLAQQTVGFDLSDMPASVKTVLQQWQCWGPP